MAMRTLYNIYITFRLPLLFWAFASLANTLAAAPPSWSVQPSDYQFNMNMVIRVSYNNVLSNDAGNVVGVFVGPELRGVATPTNIGGQMYYFVTVYSNQYHGETLRFRAYYAPDDDVYATLESVPFIHHGFTGNLLSPFRINIDPNVDQAPEILPIPADTTLQNLPFDALDLNDYLFSLDGDPVTWSVTAGPNLSASVVNGILTVTPVSSAWTGTESVQITAAENTSNGYIAMRSALFTVLPDYGPPVLQGLPSQTIFPGEAFTELDLDDYLQFNGPCRAFELRVFPYEGTDPDPAWTNVPAGPLPMTVVARPLFAGETLAGAGAKLAAFVGNTLVGTAEPSGAPPFVYYSLSLQNLAIGPIIFRFYHAENQYLYEKSTSLLLKPGVTVGTAAGPYVIQFAPLVPALSPDGRVQVTVADPGWLGDFPVDFIVKDCYFPDARRDTATAVFSVTVDNRPHLSSPSEVNFMENACSALYDAQASDPNDSEGAGLNYSITGGADAGRFAIDAGTGQLSWFNFNPDFENPADDNTDNVYEVTIRVTNTLNIFDELILAITVTDEAAEPFQALLNGGAANVCMAGSAVLQASGGSAYLWSTGSTNTSITVNTAGIYTVTVTSDGGCTASATVTVSPRPTIAAAGNSAPVCAGSNISLHSTVSDGSGVYTAFSWAGPNGFNASVEDPAPFAATPAAAGVYTVTVTDEGGCTATATTSIAVSGNSAPAVAATNNGPLCAGLTLSLGAAPSGGSGVYSSYKWSGPNGFGSMLQTPPGFAAIAAAAGVYTVTVTDNAGCTATGTTAVQVKPLPAIAVSSNSPVCTDGTVLLNSTPSGGSGNSYVFTWSGPNSFASAAEDPAGIPALAAAGGIYTVSVTDGGGCTASATASVAVKGLPAITASLLSPVCTGGNIRLASAPTGGSMPYAQFSWSGPDNFNAQAEDPAPFPAVPAAAGVYTVTVTDQAGCTATGSVSVTVHPVPAIVALGTGSVCQGGSLTLISTPSGGTAPYMLFNWTGPDNYVASVEDPAAFNVTPASAGIYQVKVTDSKGCTGTATTTVAVYMKPTVTATSNSPVCTGSNIDLQANSTGGSGVYATFSWIGPDGFMSMQQNPAGFPATHLKTGTYHLTVTDNAGCTATASTSVAVSANIAPSITASGAGPACAGGGNIVLGSTPSGGTMPYTGFAWSGPGNYAASQQNPPAFPATGVASGVYRVTVTDSKGCAGTSSVSVPVGALTAAPTTNTPLCAGSTVYLSANPSGSAGTYISFTWSGPNGYMAFVENPPGFPAAANAAGVYTVTITDNLGCSGTGTVTVSLESNDAPTIDCPADQTVAADGDCAVALDSWVSLATNVSDDCTATGNISITQTPAASTLLSGHNDEETITLTADDGTGNTTPCSFGVTLKDVTPPSITCPPDQTVASGAGCSASLGDWIYFAANLSDNCKVPGEITVTQTPVASTLLSGHNDERTVMLTANDGNGNATPCTFKVTLKDVAPPSITCPSDKTVAADASCTGLTGDWVSSATNVSDNCTASGSIQVTQLPVAGTLLSGHNDEETVTLTADDLHGNTTPCTFKVTLKDVTPPSITCPADQTLAADAVCSATLGDWTLSAINLTDNCKAPGDIAVTQIPPASTQLSGHNEEKMVTLTAGDGAGNTTPCTFKVTLRDVAPPSITCPSDKTVAADAGCTGLTGDWVSSATNVSDNCTASGSIQVTQLPVAGTLLSGHNDEETVTLTADDLHGNTTPCTFKVTLKDVTPPSITCPADQTVAADANCAGVAGDRTGLAGVADNCTAAANILVTQMPAANAPLSGHNAELTVTLTADDLHGNTASCSFKITLKDVTPPSITCPNNTTVSCTANVPAPDAGSVTAQDNCSTPVKTFLYDTAPYDSACINRFRIDRYYRAADAVGNSNSCSQRITVHDDTPPNLLFVPANVTVQCNAIPNVGTPSGADNCAGNVAVTYNGQTVSNILCTDSYTITRQWTATDACGNTKTATQRITVQDTQRPLFTSVPANVTVECSAVPNVGTATATDNCDPTVTVTFDNESRTNGSCPDTYTLTRRWLAVDNCGNTRTATQRITVRDTQKPAFTTVPQNVTIQCTEPAPNVGTATATDNCDASVTITYLGQNSTYSNCPNNYQITRVWRATDNCGNSTTAAQIITVQDTQAPVFTSVPNHVTIQCDDLVPGIGNPTATDNCSGYVQITFLGQSSTGGDCPQEYVLLRSWRAQDECGNSVTATQTITVQDTEAPVFMNPPANVTVYCSNIPSTPIVTAQDNCSNLASVTYLGQSQSPGDCSSGYTITRTWTTDDDCDNTATHTQLITVSPSFSPGPDDRIGAVGGHPDALPKDFRIMPNPSSGALQLDLSAFAGESLRVFVYNNLGVLVWERNLPEAPKTAMRLNLREQKHLPAGIYRIVVEHNGERYVKTLVLTR